MSSKQKRIFTITLFVLCLSIGLSVYIFKKRITDVYDNTIQPTSFQDVVFEKDTLKNGVFPIKNLPVDSLQASQHTQTFPFSKETSPSSSEWSNKANQPSKKNNKNVINSIPSKEKEIIKGKEIKSSDIPLMHTLNSRIRLTTFLNKFKQGDYISGIEFANLYRRDPSIGKLSKGTICNFIEKNISQLSRSGNSFIIQTIDPNGIHTKLKIPFVEDLRINIDNGAEVVIGDTFTSKAPTFSKSILLPIELQNIDILHNGEQFPTKGYVSGDYYFIDYSKTKMAYKLR